MTDARFVDASMPSVRTDDGMTLLLPTTSPGEVYYAARAVRMATGPGGRYVLSLVRRRKRKEAKSGEAALAVTQGGALAAQIELVALLPSPSEECAWTEALRRSGSMPPTDTGFTFLPLPLWQGRMSLGGLAAFVDDRTPYEGVPIGTATAVPVTAQLNSRGADAFWAAITAGGGPSAAVRLDYDYDLAVPRCAYQLTADVLAAHAVFSRHSMAVAGCYGTAGGQTEFDALCAELEGSGAVRISWDFLPEGFDSIRIATMERAIIERWAQRALDQMVDSVAPDPDAPGGVHGLGRVVVTLRDEASVANINLSERREGPRIVTERFSHSINLGQLRGLERHHYTVDVKDDDAVPMVLNCAPDPRVRHYVCHYGYRKADGAVIGGSHEAAGSEGLNVVDMIRWDSGAARPETVEIRFSVDWADLRWESRTGKTVLKTDVPCLLFSLSPGSSIAEVALVLDLASTELGTIAVVNWNATLPPSDEQHPKDYADSFLIEGTGPEGRLVREMATFPYQRGQEATTIFEWSADVALPNGTVLFGQERFSLAERTEAEIFKDRLGSA